jgi:hypothetical protein
MEKQDSGNRIMIPVYHFTNEIEAQILSQVLDEENIPHRIRSFRDSAYDGIFQMQKGWGQLEAPESYRDRINDLAEKVLHGDSTEK